MNKVCNNILFLIWSFYWYHISLDEQASWHTVVGALIAMVNQETSIAKTNASKKNKPISIRPEVMTSLRMLIDISDKRRIYIQILMNI